MIKRTRMVLALYFAITFASCSLGSDKCGKGFVEKMGACQKTTEDSDARSSEAKGADEDGSTDGSQQETVTGLDDPCSTQSECKGKDADYCMVDPNTGFGTCTIKDCTADPDNCPETHQCCTDTKELNYPPICLSASQYELATQFGYCTD